jgi:hypothetical protein
MTVWRPALRGIGPLQVDDVARLMGTLMNEKIPFSVTNRMTDGRAMSTMYLLVKEEDVERVQELGGMFMVCPKLEVTQLRGKSAALCTAGPFDVCPKRRKEVSPECWTIGGETRQK